MKTKSIKVAYIVIGDGTRTAVRDTHGDGTVGVKSLTLRENRHSEWVDVVPLNPAACPFSVNIRYVKNICFAK